MSAIVSRHCCEMVAIVSAGSGLVVRSLTSPPMRRLRPSLMLGISCIIRRLRGVELSVAIPSWMLVAKRSDEMIISYTMFIIL